MKSHTLASPVLLNGKVLKAEYREESNLYVVHIEGNELRRWDMSIMFPWAREEAKRIGLPIHLEIGRQMMMEFVDGFLKSDRMKNQTEHSSPTMCSLTVSWY